MTRYSKEKAGFKAKKAGLPAMGRRFRARLGGCFGRAMLDFPLFRYSVEMGGEDNV